MINHNKYSLEFDDIIYQLQGHGGISVYWQEITSRIEREINFRINRPSCNRWNRFFPVKSNADIFHSSYFRITHSKNTKNIITVYDFLYELGFLKRLGVPITILHKRIAIKSADAIICISENTKKDLLLIYPHLAKNTPIYVVPLATSFSLQKEVELKDYPRLVSLYSVTQQKYILFVGSRKPLYKNFKAALIGFANSELPGLGYYMICTGSPLTESETKLIKKIGLQNKVLVLDFATKEELNYLYQKAFSLVYPSIYEGFGLPPLEAMISGCPVIVCKTSSLPEVVGDSAILIDTQDSTDNISNALNQLLDNKVREDYVAKGLSRSQIFSWERAAKEHIKIYRSLLD